MKKKIYDLTLLPGAAILLLLLLFSGAEAQQSTTTLLNDLSSFDEPSASWQMAGSATAPLDQAHHLAVEPGSAIIVNNPSEGEQGEDLYTKMSHGDMDLSLDYMMPLEGNSGIYLQGRYELQLHDSWKVKVPTSANNGGIYQRAGNAEGDRSGHAPRQNASRAPGLWQHLEISFQAPRFNEQGEKIANARIISAELNGVTIHEGLELVGPTAGSVSEEEVAEAPLRIQGDHGPVAFRNIEIKTYPMTTPTLSNLEYKLYEGTFTERPDFDTLSVSKSGSSDLLTPYIGNIPEQFILHYQGTMNIEDAANYTFGLDVAGGGGILQVDGQEIIGLEGNEGTIELESGQVPFSLFYARQSDWNNPAIELSVSADGLREQVLSDQLVTGSSDWHPIYLHASDKPLLRSFRDIPGGTRLTHAISVSSLDNIHYTYDMNHGSLAQVWRGEFLNVTPMWYSRGDGSSDPSGSVETLIEQPSLVLNKLESRQDAWHHDTTGTGYRSLGYRLNDQDKPTFMYEVFEAQVEDRVRTVQNGGGFRRSIRIKNISDDMYLRLAEGSSITQVAPNRFMVDDQSYYLQLEGNAATEPFIRDTDGGQELLVPAQSVLNYTILF